MATNFVQEGKVLDTANSSGSTVSSGGVIVAGRMVRVAVNDIPNGESGPAYCEGVFELPAKSDDTWSDGDPVYWDATNGYLTATATGNPQAGFAVGAKAANATTAKVKLQPCATVASS